MDKHYSLSDFVNMIKLHRPAIDSLIQAKSSMSHMDLLEIFSLSTELKATRFTYVIGSMKGSQEDQYDATLARFRKAGNQKIVSILRSRRDFPCIDIQECIWLVNRNSDRERGRDYGYPDYGEFKDRQFISGRADAFSIDWSMLSESGDEVNQAERAFKAWKVLTSTASTTRNVTYEDLAKAIGIHHRAIRYVLGLIQDYCIASNLPPLTILVVNKQTNEPGAGFIAWSHDNLEEGRGQVRNFDWAKVSNPFEFASDGTAEDELVAQILKKPDASHEIYTKVKVRGMQQRIFRQALLKAYGGRCALSGVGFSSEMLDAAHIIPWSQCSPDLKMNPRNGVLMLCCYHRLFDIGILSIDVEYRVIFSNRTGLRLVKADQALVSALHGRKISLPKDKALWPDKSLIRQRNESAAK